MAHDPEYYRTWRKRPESKQRLACAYNAWRDRNPGFAHGLRGGQLQAIIDRQGGTCAIESCDKIVTLKSDVDHDHNHCPGRTGCPECVRGVLCRRHNILVASENELQKCLDYVQANATIRSSTHPTS